MHWSVYSEREGLVIAKFSLFFGESLVLVAWRGVNTGTICLGFSPQIGLGEAIGIESNAMKIGSHAVRGSVV